MAICARRFQQAPLDGESGRPLETWVSLLESAKFDGDEQDGRGPSSASGDDALDDDVWVLRCSALISLDTSTVDTGRAR